LTVNQYRNALADLIGGFRAPNRWDDQRGLRSEYFNGTASSRRGVFDRGGRIAFQPGERVIDRIDPGSALRFRHFHAGRRQIPKTGNQVLDPLGSSLWRRKPAEYEFIVRTETRHPGFGSTTMRDP